LASSKKKQQKIVVGDDTGIVQCFGMKRGEVQPVFKTLPMGKEIHRLELGGSKGELNKVFTSSGATIRGHTKKGKEFFKFNTNLTETIHSLYVEDDKIWAGCEFIYNQFIDCKDNYFYMSPDRINDLTVQRVSKEGALDAVLACQDRFVRVVSGSDLFYEAAVEGAPITVHKYITRRRARDASQQNPQQPAVDVSQPFKEIIYGTDSGSLGLLMMDNNSVRRGWMVSNTRKLGGIQCIASYDLTKDGVLDIMIGRDDGTVEVHGFDVSAEPRMIFQKSINESITSLEVGVIANPQYDELVLTSYSGKVLAYTAEPAVNQALEIERPGLNSARAANERAKEASDRKIRTLRADLDRLREKVSFARERYSRLSTEMIAVTSQFKINDKLILNPDDASYSLTIEIQTPIDVVCLQADSPVDLLDADSNVAIVCRSPDDADNGSKLLATFRCQDSVSRLEMKLRTIEGQFGTLQVYVIPRVTPKTCQVQSYSIKPLSLHQRVSQLEEEKRPFNELRLTGTFSVAEIHSWVTLVLPDIPARFTGEDIVMFYRNTFLGTVLICQYRKGEGIFRSDNVSTISILKEVLTKEATSRKISLKINFTINEDSIGHVLRLLHPRLDYQRSLASKMKLIEPLKELKMQEEDIGFLAPEFQDILTNTEIIEADFKNQPRRLEFLHQIICDLYVDRFKFKGLDSKVRLPALNKVIDDYDLDRLVAFFSEPIN